jgi:hypothetical protein
VPINAGTDCIGVHKNKDIVAHWNMHINMVKYLLYNEKNIRVLLEAQC